MKIEYDVTVSEFEAASKRFWKKFLIKRTVLFSLVFIICGILCITLMLDKNKSAIGVGAIGAGLSFGLGANMWLKPKRVRKKLVEVLENTPNERYITTFSDDEIKIETVIEDTIKKNNGNDGNDEDEKSESEPIIEASVYKISETELYCDETDELFLIYVNRSLIYIIPKRCLSEKDKKDLKEIFVKINMNAGH